MREVQKPPPNTKLRQARHRILSPSGSGQPMSRQELAEAINAYLWTTHKIDEGLDETDIGKLERGEHRWPGARRREAFRAVLRVSTDGELGFYINRRPRDDLALHTMTAARTPGEPAEPDGEPLLPAATLGRRHLLADGTLIAGVALTARLAHLFATEPHQMNRTLDVGSADDSPRFYETMADRMLTHYERSGPVVLLGPALEHFQAIRRLVEQRQSIDGRRRLTRAASKLATLLGIFAYEDEWRARTWFGVAQRAAVESGDLPLQAFAIAAESLLDYYGGRERSSLQSLQAARRLLNGDIVAAIVSARTARSHAALGQEQQALQALDDAQRQLAGSPQAQRELFAFTDAQLAFYSATCNLRLGRDADAEADATRALQLYEVTPQYMDPTLVRLDAATARLTRRNPDVDEAAAAARAALEELPEQHRTGPVRQRTADIVTAMRRHPDVPAAREFIDFSAQL